MSNHIAFKTFNKLQKQALDKFEAGESFFLTGGAGTGKSFVLQEIISRLRDRFAPEIYGVTSLTGVSSLLIGGRTLHSWAGIGLGDGSVDKLLGRVKRSGKAKHWRMARVLIIDEVSMMDADLFEKLHQIGCRLRQCSTRLFGGIQVIFSGDFLQLPPINGAFCFESRVWSGYVRNVVYLREIVRQRDDVALQEMLSRFRLGEVTVRDMELLNTRVVEKVPKFTHGVKPTKLFPFRKDVANINENELARLIGKGCAPKVFYPVYDVKPRIHGQTDALETARRQLLARQLLAKIKREARDEGGRCKILGEVDYNQVLRVSEKSQVMLTYNLDQERGLVNGSRGVVLEFQAVSGYPKVRFDNGIEEVIAPNSWEIEFAEYIVVVTQCPLILAWAQTIHRAQGATISLAVTDLAYVFSPGQSYVCLSRVQSLDGLYILAIDYDKIKASKKALKYYQELEEGG